MAKSTKTLMIPDEHIMNNIYLLRGQKLMLDFDQAKLYMVETKRLKEQITQNKKWLPKKFMFNSN